MPRFVLSRSCALALVAGALLGARPQTAAAQQRTASQEVPAAVPLDRLMARWELRATGVSRLTPAEREALEGWLARYVATARAATPAPARLAPSASAPAPLDTIRPEPEARPVAPAPRAPANGPTRIALSLDPVPGVLGIVAVYDGGDLVATEDGSLWETYLPDRAKTAAWAVGQSVQVRNNPLPNQLSGPPFDVTLTNGEARTAVAARYAGRRLPEGATVDGQ